MNDLGIHLQVPLVSDWLGPTRRAQRYLILAHGSANRQFMSAQALVEFQERGGPSPNPELNLGESEWREIVEDSLRASLVFACAGLDASVKALIEDAYKELARMDSVVEATLHRFAERHLSDGTGVSVKVLAEVLVNPYFSRDVLINAFVADLTGESLQSVAQVYRIAAAFRLGEGLVKPVESALRSAFRARNEIVHELDLVVDQNGRPGRRQRDLDETKEAVVAVLGTAQSLVNGVTSQLREKASADPIWSSLVDEWRVTEASEQPS